jgi:hypothetical protein
MKLTVFSSKKIVHRNVGDVTAGLHDAITWKIITGDNPNKNRLAVLMLQGGIFITCWAYVE